MEESEDLYRFFLENDGDEAQIRFLTEEPIHFYEHNIWGAGARLTTQICIGADCPRCASEDRPSFKSAWIVHDMRPFSYKDRTGKERTFPNGAIKLLVFGTKFASILDRFCVKYGLTNRIYTITCDGKGKNTSYAFEHGGEDSGLSRMEIIDLLPNAVKVMYDGSEESLQKMITEQLEREVDAISREGSPVHDQ